MRYILALLGLKSCCRGGVPFWLIFMKETQRNATSFISWWLRCKKNGLFSVYGFELVYIMPQSRLKRSGHLLLAQTIRFFELSLEKPCFFLNASMTNERRVKVEVPRIVNAVEMRNHGQAKTRL